MTTQALITAKNLAAGYGDTAIIENVNFDIHKGEVLMVIGGSGCGKSTLLKHMIGLLPPVAGQILILGQDLYRADMEKRKQILQQIGVAFQSGALFGSLTVLENVRLPLIELSSLPQKIIDDLAWMKLAQVGLSKSAHLMPSQISGGMKKRAALARAMAMDPAIIFLDEPSAGLDPVTSAELDELIKRLSTSLGITFVIVTHELASIEGISDRIIMLDKAARTLIATGTWESLKNDTTNPTVYNFFNRIIQKEDS